MACGPSCLLRGSLGPCSSAGRFSHGCEAKLFSLRFCRNHLRPTSTASLYPHFLTSVKGNSNKIRINSKRFAYYRQAEVALDKAEAAMVIEVVQVGSAGTGDWPWLSVISKSPGVLGGPAKRVLPRWIQTRGNTPVMFPGSIRAAGRERLFHNNRAHDIPSVGFAALDGKSDGGLLALRVEQSNPEAIRSGLESFRNVHRAIKNGIARQPLPHVRRHRDHRAAVRRM